MGQIARVPVEGLQKRPPYSPRLVSLAIATITPECPSLQPMRDTVILSNGGRFGMAWRGAGEGENDCLGALGRESLQQPPLPRSTTPYSVLARGRIGGVFPHNARVARLQYRVLCTPYLHNTPYIWTRCAA